jgi:hypothetical protein
MLVLFVLLQYCNIYIKVRGDVWYDPGDYVCLYGVNIAIATAYDR